MGRIVAAALVAIGIFAATAFSAQPVLAATVFNNPIAATTADEATHWVQASSFTLGSSANLTGGTIAFIQDPGVTWSGEFDYWIFGSDGVAPSSILSNGAATINSVSDTGIDYAHWAGPLDVYSIDFDFVSTFAAAASTQYWLGIHLSSDFDVREGVYWVDTTYTTSAYSAANSIEGTFDNWVSFRKPRAFTLNGDAIPPVPLPAGVWLLLSALGGLGLTGWRRKRVAA